MEKLISLHKHWINANAIKQVITTKISGKSNLSDKLHIEAEMHSAFARLSILYGLIYVVIEGYQELKYTDDDIDNLLQKEDLINALRLFRNATFHYQKKPINEKLLGFLELEESEIWINKLHLAFRSFFEKITPIKEVIERFSRSII